ncbi:hypothetical protein, partial [Salinibacter ruber]|uniref:hypothetical protein n=1 Tax=Salinibacter ruber TaxID=146919 RepID=UPI0020745357
MSEGEHLKAGAETQEETQEVKKPAFHFFLPGVSFVPRRLVFDARPSTLVLRHSSLDTRLSALVRRHSFRSESFSDEAFSIGDARQTGSRFCQHPVLWWGAGLFFQDLFFALGLLCARTSLRQDLFFLVRTSSLLGKDANLVETGREGVLPLRGQSSFEVA